MGRRRLARPSAARVPAAAARAPRLAQPQRPVGLRDSAARGVRARDVRRPHSRAVSDRVRPVGRDEEGRRDESALVSPDVRGAARVAQPAYAAPFRRDRLGSDGLPSTGRSSARTVADTTSSSSTSRLRSALPARRRSTSRSGIRPTPARSRAANRSRIHAASGTRRSPASGRPCGSSRCRTPRSTALITRAGSRRRASQHHGDNEWR